MRLTQLVRAAEDRISYRRLVHIASYARLAGTVHTDCQYYCYNGNTAVLIGLSLYVTIVVVGDFNREDLTVYVRHEL